MRWARIRSCCQGLRVTMVFASTSTAVVEPAGGEDIETTAVDKHHRAGRKMSSEPSRATGGYDAHSVLLTVNAREADTVAQMGAVLFCRCGRLTTQPYSIYDVSIRKRDARDIICSPETTPGTPEACER